MSNLIEDLADRDDANDPDAVGYLFATPSGQRMVYATTLEGAWRQLDEDDTDEIELLLIDGQPTR